MPTRKIDLEVESDRPVAVFVLEFQGEPGRFWLAVRSLLKRLLRTFDMRILEYRFYTLENDDEKDNENQ